MTFDGYAAFLKTERGLAPKTITAYVREVRDWLAFVGDMAWQPKGVEVETRTWLSSKGGSPSSVVRRLAAVRLYARFAGIPDPTANHSHA